MFRDNSLMGHLLMGVMLAAVTVIAACGPTSQITQSPAGGVPREQKEAGLTPATKMEPAKERGGKLVATNSSSFGNPNDPHLVVTNSGREYSVPVTNTVLKRDLFDEKFPIVGDLATSWEVSGDGLTYTFKLKEGVKFHNLAPVNGREMTSEDVKYSILRITAHPSLIVEKWKARYQRALDFGDIQTIETADKYTLSVKLKEPSAPFLANIAHAGTQILPREFVEKFPDKIITEGMIGTGPFMPVDYKNQQTATYKRNPDYWKKDFQGGQLPYLDELVVLYFADVQSQLAAFRARNLDFTSSIDKVNVESVKKDMPNILTLTSTSLSLTNFRFNMKFKPFQDLRVRRAVHLAIDRQQFLELLGHGNGRVAGPVTPKYAELANTMDWLLSQPGYRQPKDQDIAEAKRLMKEAGYGDGFEVQAMFTTGSTSGDWAALLGDHLKPLNIIIKAEQVDYAGQWVPRSTQGEFELSYMSHKLASDADSILSPHFLSEAPRNYGKFSDPVLDDLINKQRSAVTVEERRRWAQEAEKRILDTVPMVIMYDPYTTFLAQPWVHNVGNMLGEGTLHYVDQTWVEKH